MENEKKKENRKMDMVLILIKNNIIEVKKRKLGNEME